MAGEMIRKTTVLKAITYVEDIQKAMQANNDLSASYLTGYNLAIKTIKQQLGITETESK